MSESEFDIIRKYFTDIGQTPEALILGVGDDAAIISSPADQELLIAMDTFNPGVHFPEPTSAYDIGYKALAVNLSDIAAMGGEPKWFTLALALPELEHNWLQEFRRGLSALADRYHLKLIGGDTTKGPLSITIQIAGYAPPHQAIKRSGAQVGDKLYITGTLGDAAVGLELCQQGADKYLSYQQDLIDRLNRPTPRIEVGRALRTIATACIDISDGLAGDLKHLLVASQVGAKLETGSLPISRSLQQQIPVRDEQIQKALYYGDDYELCFTAPANRADDIAAIHLQTGCQISLIGDITPQSTVLIELDSENKITNEGFNHFT